MYADVRYTDDVVAIEGLFHMNPTVKASELRSTKGEDLLTSSGQIAARSQLTAAFGGKRKQSAAASKKRYSMDEAALNSMKAVAKSTMASTASRAVGVDDDDRESGR